MIPDEGRTAPDFTLYAADGRAVSLSATLGSGRNVLLVFLRHHQDELHSLNVEVLLISFGSAPSARAWLEETRSPFTLLLDPDRAVYCSYGAERSLLRSWNIRTIWLYLRLLLSGRRWRGIQGDSSQLGGDFIVGSDGKVRLAYRSHDPTDRPTMARLLTVLRQLPDEGRRK